MEYKFEKPVHGTIGTEKCQCSITWRNGKFLADEPEKAGGRGIGPDPQTILLSALISCTLVTLRIYIDRDIVFLSAVTDEQKRDCRKLPRNVRYPEYWRTRSGSGPLFSGIRKPKR